MLVRDVRTGQLVAVPDNRFAAAPFGGYGAGPARTLGVRSRPMGPVSRLRNKSSTTASAIRWGRHFSRRSHRWLRPCLPSLLPMIPSVDRRIGVVAQVHRRPIVGSAAGRIRFGYPSREHARTGRHARVSYYGAAPPQVIYDGLGNPLGLPFLAALAPMLSSLLPTLRQRRAKILPGLISQAATALPSPRAIRGGTAFDGAAATCGRCPNASPTPVRQRHRCRMQVHHDGAGTAHADATLRRSHRTDACVQGRMVSRW
jgi:hypothetical protein